MVLGAFAKSTVLPPLSPVLPGTWNTNGLLNFEMCNSDLALFLTVSVSNIWSCNKWRLCNAKFCNFNMFKVNRCDWLSRWCFPWFFKTIKWCYKWCGLFLALRIQCFQFLVICPQPWFLKMHNHEGWMPQKIGRDPLMMIVHTNTTSSWTTCRSCTNCRGCRAGYCFFLSPVGA